MMGQSAGSFSATYHLVSPLSRCSSFIYLSVSIYLAASQLPDIYYHLYPCTVYLSIYISIYLAASLLPTIWYHLYPGIVNSSIYFLLSIYLFLSIYLAASQLPTIFFVKIRWKFKAHFGWLSIYLSIYLYIYDLRGLFKRVIAHSGVGGFSPSYHQYSTDQAVR